jgi:nucleoside-diphosphate-sugar epimerase
MSATVLVTGGHGFIGAWVLRELLQRGCTPVVLDLAEPGTLCRLLLGERARDLRWTRGDILDTPLLEELLKTHAVSHAIHLVGLLTPACQADPVKGGEVNVLGVLRVFDALRRRGLKNVAYASSYAVHGPSSGAPSPETFYGAFKRAAEGIAEQYARHFGLNSVGLRPFVVYGAGRESGISAGPSLAAKAGALGQDYTFPFSGSVGLVYVEDVARAFVRCALETPPGARVIDMPGNEATVAGIIELLGRIQPGCERRLRISGPALPGLANADPILMHELFDDWSATPVEEGLKRTVAGWKTLSRYPG